MIIIDMEADGLADLLAICSNDNEHQDTTLRKFDIQPFSHFQPNLVLQVRELPPQIWWRVTKAMQHAGQYFEGAPVMSSPGKRNQRARLWSIQGLVS